MSQTDNANKAKQLLERALDYDFGRNGMPHDPKKAVEYYIKSLEIAESGVAHYNLAMSYLQGDGVEKDEEKGYDHLLKAYKIGSSSAAFYIARCYETGQGTSIDFPKAARFYRDAIKRGHIAAAYKLGLLTKNGKGVEKDPSEAFRLFGIAAKSDEKSVKPEWLYEYAHCFFIGFGTTKNPAAGIDMMRRAAEAGNADAQYAMANAYAFGHGVAKNESEHKQWLAKAANNGNMFAQFERGEDLAEAAPQLAIKFFQRAASQGHVLAQVRLQELETEVENSKVESLVKQAEQGYRRAQFELGMRYLHGEGVSQNNRRGFDWLSEAAEQGDKNALAELGWCYLEGVGVPRPNAMRAFVCFEEAAGPIKSSTNRRALEGLYHCFSKGEGTRRDRDLADEIKYKLDLNALSGGMLW
jgi:TPR repeat protein